MKRKKSGAVAPFLLVTSRNFLPLLFRIQDLWVKACKPVGECTSHKTLGMVVYSSLEIWKVRNKLLEECILFGSSEYSGLCRFVFYWATQEDFNFTNNPRNFHTYIYVCVSIKCINIAYLFSCASNFPIQICLHLNGISLILNWHSNVNKCDWYEWHFMHLDVISILNLKVLSTNYFLLHCISV